MKKILLLLIVFVSVAFSSIDECKTDVYFSRSTSPEVECILKSADNGDYSSLIEMYKATY